MRPFGCAVTILNTIHHLGKFDGKAYEGFFVGYSLNIKAFRVFNNRTRIVEENLHIRFSVSTPNVVGTQSNGFTGTKASDNAFQAKKETGHFRSTAMAKTINGEAHIHAKVDGKKVIINEASIRIDLQLDDGEGVDCLSNTTIFEQLALMGKPTRKFTQLPHPSDPIEHVADKAVHKELGDSFMRAATTASSIEAEQDSCGEEVFVAEQEVVSSAATTVTTKELTLAQDKGKRIMIKEHVKPKKKDQIMVDEKAAKRLKAEFDEEERFARERAQKEQETNIALIETWNDIQAKIDADHQLAERLQVEDQEELSDAEKAIIFVQLWEKRRKHFAAKRLEEKKNKPPTQAQKKKIISVNTFEDFRSELVEGKQKREGDELIQESAKKQKIYKEGKKSYYQIMRVDGKTQMYMVFSKMLESFDIKDLEDLYKLVKAKFKSTRPVEDLDLLLYVTTTGINVNAAHLELVLLKNFNGKYTKCLLLLVEVKTAGTKINAASGT
nr:retrovirus-related Pol polyprotein from transposon TNT 1-94 [Tanacetum cinerariifolium]